MTGSIAPDPRSRSVTDTFLTDAGEPRAFVIVSSARSGSNLLVSYLRQVRRAACFGEIFRSQFPEKPGWDALSERLDLPETTRSLHAEDLTAWWELILERGLARRHWLGAKIFHYHRPGDPIWARFEAADHRVLHLLRDATFDQYVSRMLAVESGAWKGGDGDVEPRVRFDRDAYLRYRTGMRAGIEAIRSRYGSSDRYVEIEYRQLSDHARIGRLIKELFGEEIRVEETLRRQRTRPKSDYLVNPDDAAPFVNDSIDQGFAADEVRLPDRRRK